MKIVHCMNVSNILGNINEITFRCYVDGDIRYYRSWRKITKSTFIDHAVNEGCYSCGPEE